MLSISLTCEHRAAEGAVSLFSGSVSNDELDCVWFLEHETAKKAARTRSDVLRIEVKGKGGHASEPFRTLDPVPVACEIVTALQAFVTRRVEIWDPAVITVTKLIAGTATNVIPEVARVEGTIRAMSAATRKKVHDGIKRVAEGIAAAHDMEATVKVELGYPVTVNDGPSADFALDVAEAIVGNKAAVRMPHAVMGA
ncbi:MAG: hypothetical protein EBR09_16250, partial [Proteobacteria bacterium]|nr:hypothetical protein [Pseudomonadota bacterium]